MTKELTDAAARNLIEYTIHSILTNVSTSNEIGEGPKNNIRKTIDNTNESLFALEPNTPLGIVQDRTASFMADLGTETLSPEHINNLRKMDKTVDNLLDQTIYMYSSGYSLHLNELRTIIPNDIDTAITHVNDTVSQSQETSDALYQITYFDWGQIEDPSYQSVLTSFLQQNVNILKSPKNSLSDVQNFSAIMKRIDAGDQFSDTTMSDSVMKAHNIPEKLQKHLTSRVAFENFINHTKSILSLNNQHTTLSGLLPYIEDIKQHAPIVKELLSSSYQDDMSDNLVTNISVMNHTLMLVESLIWYLKDVTFKNAAILPSGGHDVVINQPVYKQHFQTENDASAGKDNISNVIYYLHNNMRPVTPGAFSVNKWVPYRSGISHQRILELKDKATQYREKTEQAYMAKQRQKEIYQIRDAMSTYLDTWFAGFKEKYDITNVDAYNKLHATHKQVLLNKVKNITNDSNTLSQYLMDYFVAVRNSPLLTNLYRSTKAFYVNNVANEDAQNVTDTRARGQEHAVIQTFLDFFLKNYAVPLPKND